MSTLEIMDIDKEFLTDEKLQILDKYYEEYYTILDDCDKDPLISKEEWCLIGNYAIVKDEILMGYIITYQNLTEPDFDKTIIIDTLYISPQFLDSNCISFSEVLSKFITEASEAWNIKKFKLHFPIKNNPIYNEDYLFKEQRAFLEKTSCIEYHKNPIKRKRNLIYSFGEEKRTMKNLPENWFIFQCTYDEETFLEHVNENSNEIWCLLGRGGHIEKCNSLWMHYNEKNILNELRNYCFLWSGLDDGRIIFKRNGYEPKIDVICLLPFEPRGSFVADFIHCPDTHDFNTLLEILQKYENRFQHAGGVLLGLMMDEVTCSSIFEVEVEKSCPLESIDLYIYLK